jgi:hypothetical protein
MSRGLDAPGNLPSQQARRIHPGSILRSEAGVIVHRGHRTTQGAQRFENRSPALTNTNEHGGLFVGLMNRS